MLIQFGLISDGDMIHCDIYETNIPVESLEHIRKGFYSAKGCYRDKFQPFIDTVKALGYEIHAVQINSCVIQNNDLGE